MERLLLPGYGTGQWNAVLEGSYHGPSLPPHDEIWNAAPHGGWRDFHYKLVQLDVPLEDGMISDGTYLFRSLDINVSGQVFKNNGLLGWRAGVLVHDPGASMPLLERPRMICFADGRMFVEERMREDGEYMRCVPGIVEQANKIWKQNC